MILKLAWRNIWRNKTRSLVIMSAIIVGVAASIFLLSFITGQIQSYINNTIQNEISHLQAHHPTFKDDFDIKYLVTDIEQKLEKIRSIPNVTAASSRTIVNGIISSPKASRGVTIRGIDYASEELVTKMNTKVIEGEYLSESKRNPILIGKRLADKLKVKIRKKIVVRFQNIEGDIVDGAFRIVGIYKTNKNQFDEGNVFIRKQDLNDLAGITEGAHEIAVFLDSENELQTTASLIQDTGPEMLVETYEEISPDVRLFKTQIGISSTFIMTIIMLALFFGIINTMLMAVLERYRELGMLMSIGMNKIRIFCMILLETVLIGIISAPIGMLIGYIAVMLTAINGIDLSAYSEGMSEFGLSSVVYPVLQSQMYIQLAFAVFFTTVLAGIYPAYKAVKLNPVEAIRKI